MPPDEHPFYKHVARALERMGYVFLGRHPSGYAEFERIDPTYHTVAVPSHPYADIDEVTRTLIEQGVSLDELIEVVRAIRSEQASPGATLEA